jgi:hypothetical protein
MPIGAGERSREERPATATTLVAVAAMTVASTKAKVPHRYNPCHDGRYDSDEHQS